MCWLRDLIPASGNLDAARRVDWYLVPASLRLDERLICRVPPQRPVFALTTRIPAQSGMDQYHPQCQQSVAYVDF